MYIAFELKLSFASLIHAYVCVTAAALENFQFYDIECDMINLKVIRSNK